MHDLGCNQLQGYLLGSPLALNRIKPTMLFEPDIYSRGASE